MTAPVREPPGSSVRASWTAGEAWAFLRRALFPAAIVGAFLAFIGGFDSNAMPLVARVPFMVGISFFATCLGMFVFRAVLQIPWAKDVYWRAGLVSAVLMFLPMGLFVWGAVRLVTPPGHGPTVTAIPQYMTVSLATSLFFCLLVAWMRRDRTHPEVQAPPAPPKFLERLPLKLRGAEIWAIEAEDHYLRLHTSKGQDLILLRLADAVAELDGIEGAQVHRSWWVARDAIVDAKRGDGRATLTLKDGAEVPVSRTYAGELRDKGWI